MDDFYAARSANIMPLLWPNHRPSHAAVIIARTLIFGIDAPSYAPTMVAILVFGAFNMISIGLLGEYVGRIAIEVAPFFL